MPPQAPVDPRQSGIGVPGLANKDNVYHRNQNIPPVQQTGAPVPPNMKPPPPAPTDYSYRPPGETAEENHRRLTAPMPPKAPQAPPMAPQPTGGPTGIAQAAPQSSMLQKAREYDMGAMTASPGIREQEARNQQMTDQAATLGNIGEQNALRARLEKELAAQNEPRKRRNERFAAMAAGAGGRNSSAAAGGIAGSYNARNSQEAKRLQGIDALNKMLGTETSANKAYGEGLTKSGVDAYNKSTDRSDAASGRVQDSILTEEANKLSAQTRDLIANNAAIDRLTAQKTNINIELRRVREAQQDALSSSREYMTAKNELAKARKSGDENKIALAQAAVQEIEQKALAPHAEAIRSLTETRDLIDRELGVAPPATAAGSSGWGTAKQVR